MAKTTSCCEQCSNYFFDEEGGYYICDMPLDLDDMERFLTQTVEYCPYYRFDDEYAMVRKQN